MGLKGSSLGKRGSLKGIMGSKRKFRESGGGRERQGPGARIAICRQARHWKEVCETSHTRPLHCNNDSAFMLPGSP